LRSEEDEPEERASFPMTAGVPEVAGRMAKRALARQDLSPRGRDAASLSTRLADLWSSWSR
jgi:hypothetical protein